MFFDLPTRGTVDNFASFDRCIACCASRDNAVGSALDVAGCIGLERPRFEMRFTVGIRGYRTVSSARNIAGCFGG